MNMGHAARIALAGMALFVWFSGARNGEASNRRFTYLYEAKTQPKGRLEFEQGVTEKAGNPHGSSSRQYDFRHELEYGISDHLQVGLYVADWRYREGGGVDGGAEYLDTGLEWICQLSDPTADPLGVALYQETKVGDELLALEAKLILQKNVGPLSIAYNVALEAEWEGPDYKEKNGEFQQALGASWEFAPSFSAGAEVLHELVFEEWKDSQDSVLYAGPNASYHSQRWWITVTPMLQVTGVKTEPDFQARLLLGVEIF